MITSSPNLFGSAGQPVEFVEATLVAHDNGDPLNPSL